MPPHELVPYTIRCIFFARIFFSSRSLRRPFPQLLVCRFSGTLHFSPRNGVEVLLANSVQTTNMAWHGLSVKVVYCEWHEAKYVCYLLIIKHPISSWGASKAHSTTKERIMVNELHARPTTKASQVHTTYRVPLTSRWTEALSGWKWSVEWCRDTVEWVVDG